MRLKRLISVSKTTHLRIGFEAPTHTRCAVIEPPSDIIMDSEWCCDRRTSQLVATNPKIAYRNAYKINIPIIVSLQRSSSEKPKALISCASSNIFSTWSLSYLLWGPVLHQHLLRTALLLKQVTTLTFVSAPSEYRFFDTWVNNLLGSACEPP